MLVVGNRITYKYKGKEGYITELITNKQDILLLESDIEKGLIEDIKVEACNWETIEFEEE